MCDKIRPFQGASETTENGYKWSEKSEGYIFIPNIVDQNVKKTHPAGLENTAIPQFKIKITEIPHEKLANTAIPQTPMSPSIKSGLQCTNFVSQIFCLQLSALIIHVYCFLLSCPRAQLSKKFICIKQSAQLLFKMFGKHANMT